MTQECKHEWRPKSIEYGRYIGKGADRYQEMLHARVCKNCGNEETSPTGISERTGIPATRSCLTQKDVNSGR